MMNLKKCFPAGLRFYTSTLVLFQRAFVKKKKKEEEEQFKKKKRRSCIDTYCVKYIRKQEKSVFLM